MKLLLLFLAGFFILATVLPFVETTAWWVRIFDFPRVQIAVAGFGVLVVCFFFWDRSSLLKNVVLGALALSVVYQGYRMAPYTPIAPEQVQDSESGAGRDSFRMMVSNVLMTNRDPGGLLAVVRAADPDLLLTVETDAWWERQLRPLEDAYPHQVKHPLDNTYGMLLYSRLELVDAAVRFIVEEGVPSIFTDVVLPSGNAFQLVCLHPRPPRPDKPRDTDQRDAELLLVGKALQAQDRPTVVAGDLNDVAWSNTTQMFQKISGLLDPRRGRGLYSTFHADHFWLRYPLDHVFHSDHFRLLHIERLPHVGSDHFPVLVELSYEPRGRIDQPEPEATPEEEEKARERIEEGLRKQEDESGADTRSQKRLRSARTLSQRRSRTHLVGPI